MTERMTSRRTEFVNAFVLRGVDGRHPAGSDELETMVERIEGLSFAVYRRNSTTIARPAASLARNSRQITPIDPMDLATDTEAPNGQSQV